MLQFKKKTEIDNVDGLEVIRVGTFKKIASQSLSTSYGKELKQILKSFKPDIIIFHYPNPFVAFFLEKYLKKKTFKFILYWHLDITKQKILGKFFAGQNKRLLKYADKIVATSPNYINGSSWLLPNKYKCEVIPSCINEDRLKINDENIQNANKIRNKYIRKKICFAFGRHVEYKGFSYLIQASRKLSDEYIILIGGQGPLTQSLIKEARNDNKIVFLGLLSDDELKEYLMACDIFCFPSITKNEAFGLGLAEAMYYGKPAVTFNIPGSGVNYVNLNNVTGLEVENCNIEKYAEAIIKISSLDFGYNARERVKTQFMFYKFKENIINLLKKVD